MEIITTIQEIKYKASCCTQKLKVIQYKDFDINTAPTTFTLQGDGFEYNISKWVSPKRTRSYPFARIYDSLTSPNKNITIIPVIKDEGIAGERDYLQWDTIAWMSLLDIYVIPAYYNNAQKKGEKVTKQQFDNDYVIQKVTEINNYRSSSLHWNLNETEKSLPDLVNKAKQAYQIIAQKTGVQFHNEKGIERFKEKIEEGISNFRQFSRKKTKVAQNAEQLTNQPKEALLTLSKATITILNYLGGEYYLTVDEVEIKQNELLLIEGKHTRHDFLPKTGDIKDGLLKTILYVNLDEIEANGQKYVAIPVLKLTSEKISGRINSKSKTIEVDNFLSQNSFSIKEKEIISALFKEAQENNFLAVIAWATR